MPPDFEVSQGKMDELVTWANTHDYGLRRNEADTRLHLIDQILFECLGWRREDCRTEEHFDGKITDYSLGQPEKHLVVEAKREGVYFELPEGQQKRVYKLRTVSDSNDAVAKAINQALDYCQKRGIGIGAICNGHQIVAFLGSRQDGIPPLEGEALVFTSLEEIRDNFREFWQQLSYPGIVARNIYVTLKGNALPPPPEKLSQRLHIYPGFKNRNPFQTELHILGDIVIEDLARTPEIEDDFLRQCYCPSGALSQYALISKQILQTRYSSLFQKEIEATSLHPSQTKVGVAKELAADVLAASIKKRAIILLGDVGVGKSIFIRHLIKVDAADVFGKSIVIEVDFGREPALATDLQEFVLRKATQQLLKRYNVDIEQSNFVHGVYHFDLQRFEKGIFAELKKLDPKSYQLQEIEFLNSKIKDKASHLKSSLEHISKARGQQIVFFLDNIDQRPFEYQEQVFLIGQSLAESWPATVFITLRPDTFAHSRLKGSLTAYQPRVFTVSPPRVDLVLSKRLKFALQQLSSEGRLAVLPSGLTIQSPSLSEYLQVLLESFENSELLIEFIDNLSGGNIREALGFISDFVGSGHVNAEKIMLIAKENRNTEDQSREKQNKAYTIPVHEFMRAVLFKDHEHYDPSVSRIANLFDISLPDGREHFLLPNILSFAERSGALGVDEGFVELERLFSFAQSLGFQPVQIKFALDRAISKKLLEPNPRFAETISVTSVRITTVGAYSVKRLISDFAYVDAMIVDTPVVDDEIRKSLGNEVSLMGRLDRADLFRKYLDAQWASIGHLDVAFDWKGASTELQTHVDRVRRKQQQVRPTGTAVFRPRTV